MTFSTFGELRSELANEGLRWTVNPNFGDAVEIPRPALGADFTQWPRAADVPRVDVTGIVAALPPTNTLLRSHLVARGLIEPLTIDSAPVLGTLGPQARTGALMRRAGPAFPMGGPMGGPPTSVDWRNRFGWPWITEIRDQDPCEHCWVYASIALVEAMVRIEHCVWCMRSEGDYIEANKVPCGQCGNAPEVLTWIQNNAIADLDCVPWADRDPGDRSSAYWNPWPNGCGGGSMQAPPVWAPCSDRSGRTVRTPAYTTLGDTTDEKNWLDTVGPLVVGFDVYSDFYGWSGTTPYTKSSTATYEGGHIMLAVGYDDGLGCWIVKNSWGTGWGDSGFGLIGYGQCNIDTYAMIGLQLTNPDPWTKRRNHSGGMIESGDGARHCNFELLAPSSSGNSFTHWWRDNSQAALPWNKAEVLGNDVGEILTFTGTTYNRNFETVYPTTASRLHHWYFDQGTQTWNDGEIFGPNDVVGPAGFIESSYGPGNFEVVACRSVGQLEHWWRDSASNWHQGPAFGSGIAAMGASLVQSTWGNLELVAVLSDGQMQHWWRADAFGMIWIIGAIFGSGISASSPPCMIQGQYGMANEYGIGNFELCVALPDGTVQHWWRNNQAPGFPWTMSATFGSNVDCVIALIEGSFGFNLEVIVLRKDGMLQHYWRDGSGWNAGAVIGPA
jgi:hypothetical protein